MVVVEKYIDLGIFSRIIDISKLVPNSDDTFDYNGDLDFSFIGLFSLTEIPIRFKNVHGFFSCRNNQLKNLKGAPEFVKKNFFCNINQLISLEGAPKEVGGNFICFSNKLISVQYAPKNLGGKFDCSYNNLLNFNIYVKNYLDYDFSDNPFKITNKVIESVKRMTYEQQMAELDYFESKDSLAFKMMKKVLDELGIFYGPKTRDMRTLVNGYDDISNLV